MIEVEPRPSGIEFRLPDWRQAVKIGAIAAVGVLGAGSGASAQNPGNLTIPDGDFTVMLDKPEKTGVFKRDFELEIGGEDEAAITANIHGRRERGLELIKNLDGSWLRVMVYQRPWRHGSNWLNYDHTISAAREKGLKVHLTITDTEKSFTPKEFTGFTKRVVRRYGDQVDRYSIYNEPNCCGWLRPNRSWTKPESYRRIYRPSYEMIKKYDPSAEVLLGELSGKFKPIEFLREMLCLQEGGEPECDPLIADGVAIHPYQFTTPPTKDHPTPNAVGIGSLNKLNEFLAEAYEAGVLTTPEGGLPSIHVTEYGLFNNGKGSLEDRNLPEGKRAKWLIGAVNQACTTPNVKSFYYYQFFPSGQRWDTSLARRNGTTTMAYRWFNSWTERNPQCVDESTELMPL